MSDDNNTYIDDINNDFDDFQEELKRNELNLKYHTVIEVDDDFYSMIDEMCGTELSSIK